MLLSALDPALLMYNQAHWQAREPHCFRRLAALSLHRRMVREYGQRMAMSDPFAALIYQYFPWSERYRGIVELRDLRQFVLEDLQRAHYIQAQVSRDVRLHPTGIVCQYVSESEIIMEWEALLCGCVDEAVLTELAPQVSTWETPSVRDHSGPMTLTLQDSKDDKDTQHHLPIVWDEDSWAFQLSTQNWWPDLQRCIELHFRTNPGLRSYSGIREKPIPFACSKTFRMCLNRHCRDQQLRRSLIEALTKRVYGVIDASLGDESIGKIRRFRVTNFWRVHYREEDDRLVLEEFGPHSIGGVS